MEFEFSCGRCAHRIKQVRPTRPPRVCPVCNSPRLYRLGVEPESVVPSTPPKTQPANTPDSPAVVTGPQANEHSPPPNSDKGSDAATRATQGRWSLLLILPLVAGLLWWLLQPPAAQVEVGVLPEPGPADVAPIEPPVEPVEPARKVASTLEEAKNAIVKFELPLGIGDLKRFGTGFLMNDQGWVATNQHVIRRMTKSARVKLADGTRLEVEGVVARAPEKDLAIVKLRNPPEAYVYLDVTQESEPELGSEVFAFGHPYDAEFSLSKGIVSRVLTTAELTDGSRTHVVTRLASPQEMVWIQHDAKISPGNSGGPLIDEEARVFGVNTFVHTKAEFGYASCIDSLRLVAETASGRIEELPDAGTALQARVSSQRIRELFQSVSTFDWNPQTLEQYEEVAELTKQMTLAKHAQVKQPPGSIPQSAVIDRVAALADERFGLLREVSWNLQTFQTLNRFAAEQIVSVGEGVPFYGTILGNANQGSALIVRLEGTGQLAVVQVAEALTKLPKGTRVLVLGFVLPRRVKLQSGDQMLNRRAPLLLADYILILK